MAEEQILIDIRLEKGDNEKQIDNLTNSLTALTKANQTLIAENKNLAKTGQENSKQYQDNAKSIELNKQKIAENTASRKGLIQAIIAEDNSIKGLQIQNANLIKQRNLINTTTDQGRAAIQSINARIDENNEKIRENSSAMEKQRMNIGNYASALDAIHPGLGAFVTRIEASTKAALTFIATPLGATLAAIALVLVPLIKYFKETGEGQDQLERATAQANAVLKIFNDQIIQLAKALLGFPSEIENNGLVKFFKVIVDNTPNIVTLTKLLYKLIPEQTRKDLEETAKLAGELADALDNLKDSEERYGIQAARTSNEVKELLLQAKNRTLTEQERIDLLERALSIESNAAVQRKAFADEELSILVERNRKRLEGFNISQKEDETQAQFAENNIENIRAVDEALAQSIINALIKIEEAAGEGIAIQEKALNMVDALLEKQEEKEAKRKEAAKKAKEKEIEDAIKLAKDLSEAENEQFENNSKFLSDKFKEGSNILKEQLLNDQITKEQYNTQIAQLEIDALEERKAFLIANGEETIEIDTAITDAKIKNKEREIEEKKKLQKKEDKIQEDTIKLAQQGSATIAGLLRDGTTEFKTAAITETGISTYSAAQKAYESQFIPGDPSSLPRAILAAAFSVLQGLGRVKTIAGFASGGLINPSHGSPIQRGNGDNRLITARTGEVILNETQQAMLGGSDTFRRIGVPGFATGGIVGNETRLANVSAQNRFDVNQLAGLINQVQTVLVLEEFQAKAESVNKVQRTARVIGG